MMFSTGIDDTAMKIRAKTAISVMQSKNAPAFERRSSYRIDISTAEAIMQMLTVV